jgi:hypothetical protein
MSVVFVSFEELRLCPGIMRRAKQEQRGFDDLGVDYLRVDSNDLLFFKTVAYAILKEARV